LATQIFTSYARDDDAVPPGKTQAKGFVTVLHEQLLYEFRNLGEPRPILWRDTRVIERGDQFEPLIEEAIAASSLLVVVLSRNWMARKWCRRELESFARSRHAEDERSLRRRIIMVGKNYVPEDERPLLLQGQEGYNFFVLEGGAVAGEEHEFFERGEIRDADYTKVVNELARFLWRRASDTGSADREPSPSPGGKPLPPLGPKIGRSVYLAKPAADMRLSYQRLVAELERRGYGVLPDPEMDIPYDASAVALIDGALASAEISVHLLGEKAGYAPEDQDPIVKLQLTRAAARLAGAGETLAPSGRGFRRLLWAPKAMPNGAALPEIQRDPLAVLTRMDRQLPSDKIIGDNLTAFIGFLVAHLDETGPAREAPEGIAGDARVYLYHRVEDEDYALQLAKALQRQRLEPIIPALEGSPLELEEHHRKNLRYCDTVVLCWARAPEVWARATARELANWRGLGRSHGFACRGLIAGPPPGRRKRIFVALPPRSEIDLALDLTAFDEPPDDELQPLVRVARPVAQ
jgi:hypothetical protein